MSNYYEKLASLELSELAFNKGFDGHCRAGYYVFDNRAVLPPGVMTRGQGPPKFFHEDADEDGGPVNYAVSIGAHAYYHIGVPTLDSLETWLRETHGIVLSQQTPLGRFWVIVELKDQSFISAHVGENYDHAREIGLEKALQLVELVLTQTETGEMHHFTGRRETLGFLKAREGVKLFVDKRNGNEIYPSLDLDNALNNQDELVEGFRAEYRLKEGLYVL